MRGTSKSYIFGHILIFDIQNSHYEKVKTLLNFLFLILQFRLLFIFSHIWCVEKVSHFLWLMVLMPRHQVCLKKMLRRDSGPPPPRMEKVTESQRGAVTVRGYKQALVRNGAQAQASALPPKL